MVPPGGAGPHRSRRPARRVDPGRGPASERLTVGKFAPACCCAFGRGPGRPRPGPPSMRTPHNAGPRYRRPAAIGTFSRPPALPTSLFPLRRRSAALAAGNGERASVRSCCCMHHTHNPEALDSPLCTMVCVHGISTRTLAPSPCTKSSHIISQGGPSIEGLIRKHEHNSRVIARAGLTAPHATSSSASPLAYSRP